MDVKWISRSYRRLLKINVKASVSDLLWMTDCGQIVKLMIVSIITNLIFLHVNSFSLILIPTADKLRSSLCPWWAAFRPRFLLSWVAKHLWHLSSRSSLKVKQFAFVIYRHQMTNWSYTIYWEKRGTDLIFPHNSTCHVPLCLTFFSVVLILADLPHQEIPFIFSYLQGSLISPCGSPWYVVCPHHLFSPASHLFVCSIYFVGSCSFIDSRPLIEQWSNKKTPGINMTGIKKKERKKKRKEKRKKGCTEIF